MNNLDLIARSFGYIGVFASLCALEFVNDITIETQPQKEYSKVTMTIYTDKPIAKIQTTNENATISKVSKETKKEEKVKKEIVHNEVKQSVSKTQKAITTKPLAHELKKTKNQPQKNNNIVKKQNITQSNSKNLKNNKHEVNQKNVANNQISKNNESQLNDDSVMRNTLHNLIVDKIKSSLNYPKNAIRRKLQGTVLIEFKINNGIITSFKLLKSSGYSILDNAAIKVAKNLIGFNTNNVDSNFIINVPIQYSLISNKK